MKRLLLMIAVLTGVFFASSCKKDDLWFNADAVTGSVTDVSLESFTFNGTFSYDGGPGTVAEAGFFVDERPGVTDAHCYLTTSPEQLARKSKNVPMSHIMKNQVGTITKMYVFTPGSTCYYRAYVRVVGADGGEKYIYGEEKSFQVPDIPSAQ